MPQTIEAINHAKAARVPIIVAINKIDKPDAKPERVRTELLQHEVQVESFGGEVVDVEVSAKNKTNLDKLLEMIDRKSTRLNSSHPSISYAVFCLKKKKTKQNDITQKKTKK